MPPLRCRASSPLSRLASPSSTRAFPYSLHSLSLPASHPRCLRSARTDIRHGRASRAHVHAAVLADGSVVGQAEHTTVSASPPFLPHVCLSWPISTRGRRRRHGHSNAADLTWPSHLKQHWAEPVRPIGACRPTGARAALLLGPQPSVLAGRGWSRSQPPAHVAR
jgi:hypothetical protein